MDFQTVAGIISGILFAIGAVPYFWSITHRRTKPIKGTWATAFALDVALAASMYSAGALNWQIASACFIAGGVVLLAMKYGQRGWSRRDKQCLMVGVVGIAIWQFTSDPLIGIVAFNGAMFWAAIPMFQSAWRNPENEDAVAWFIFWASCVFMLLGVREWTLENAIQPVVFMVNQSVMVYLTLIRPRLKKKAAAST